MSEEKMMFDRQKIRQTIEAFLPEMISFRHNMHQNPELSLVETETADKVAELLQGWGYQVQRHFGGHGIVASLTVGQSKRSIGIRADMDALPIFEETNLPYASKSEGVMHACGHDGHTTTLLAAARYLAQTRQFDGTIHLFFQPAEEVGKGAKAMIADGLFSKFPCDAVFGLHNWPGLEQGKIQITRNAMMASVDAVTITIQGKGGHGAAPEQTVDPIIVASSTIMALQTIVSRNVPPLEAAIISTGSIHGGHAFNIIPDTVEISMTVRTFSAEIQDKIEQRIRQIVTDQAQSFGASAVIRYDRLVPVLVNHPAQADFAAKVAAAALGKDKIVESQNPTTVSEDFAFMLQACPGSFFFLGNGDSAGLHNPHYNFDDRNIIDGALFWSALTQSALPVN